MSIEPNATISDTTFAWIAAEYGLGEPLAGFYVARGAMGAVNRLDTSLNGNLRSWAIKRAFWNQYSEHAVAAEVNFTKQCVAVGVSAVKSIARIVGDYVLTVNDQGDSESQYRVLEWVEGEMGRADDAGTIPPLAEWMARIHRLAIDPAEHGIDPWYVMVTYDWDDLSARLVTRAPDVAETLRVHRGNIRELSDFVNSIKESGAVWCHTDISASNLVWGVAGPHLIDWEDAGPLVPHQELGCWLRSLGRLGKSAYVAYREAGGPAEITDVTHIASSIASHLNYIGSQAELLLDNEHIEQHEFALSQVTGAARSTPNFRELNQWIKDLQD